MGRKRIRNPKSNVIKDAIREGEEWMRSMERTVAGSKKQPTEAEAEKIARSSADASRISLTGDRAFAEGYDAIFGKKKRKRA
ncbi:MAG: hypothetical protein G01um1014106_612 [Parcubacteria group bacterium Gr01-1014_106]|nr:MAG: hypothetical protein G01um1014106_612 [Parcubacteria group bacterium Gr01-1014_106]